MQECFTIEHTLDIKRHSERSTRLLQYARSTILRCLSFMSSTSTGYQARCKGHYVTGHVPTSQSKQSQGQGGERGNQKQVYTRRECAAEHSKYLKVVIKGRAQTGDAISGDWKGEARGASHKYDDVVVDKDGKALVGNKYGGKNFWDD